MKTFAYITSVFALALPAAGFSQTTTIGFGDPDLITAEEEAARTYLANELARFDSDADVDIAQVGDRNRAELQLLSEGARNSTAIIAQVGPDNAAVRDNEVTLVLSGSANDFSIVQQGDGNRYTGDVVANDAELSILQRGNFNAIDQDTRLQTDASLLLQQEGDGNYLNADDYEGLSGRQIIVRQTGGASATLRDVGVDPVPR